MKFNKKIIVLGLILVVLCLVGCSNNTESVSDSLKFKNEYEQYNDEYNEVEIDEDNIIIYADSDKINELLNSGTAVIYIGDPMDNLSRTAIQILLKAADNTDLSKIYYIDSLDNINLSDDMLGDIPLVINVVSGSITSYHYGTIDEKEDLSDEEEVELYNIYIDGIHEVLQDVCDEEERC